MMDATLEKVVKLAEQLNPQQQNLLIYRLRVKQMHERMSGKTAQSVAPHKSIETYQSPSREDLLRDAEILRTIPVRPGDTLLGKYANPNVPNVSEDEFHAQMHAIATEWEQELDEFSSDKT